MDKRRTTNILLLIIVIILAAPGLIIGAIVFISNRQMDRYYYPKQEVVYQTPPPITSSSLSVQLRSMAEIIALDRMPGSIVLTSYNHQNHRCSVQLFLEGIDGDSVAAAAAGDESAVALWDSFIPKAVEMQTKMQSLAEKMDYTPIQLDLTVFNYNDTNSALLRIEDGKIVYNALDELNKQ